MELLGLDVVFFVRLLAKRHKMAAITHNMSIRPAMHIPIAKLFCDIHILSSGVCNKIKMLKKKHKNIKQLLVSCKGKNAR